MMVRSFLETPVPAGFGYSPASVAQSLAEGLQKAGHDVTFYGPEGTDLDVFRIETCGLRPFAKTPEELHDQIATPDLFSDYRFAVNDAVMARHMLERAHRGEFDVVIFHHFESVLPIASLYPTVPIVYILHDFMDEERNRLIGMTSSPNQHFVSISNSQRQYAPDLNYLATVYNGIDIGTFTPGETNGDESGYLFYSGRITQYKGAREAVQIALQTKRRLLIAGSLSKQDYWYFDEYIKPYLDDQILFLGMLDREQLVKYYQKASALLVPIQWEEPFGLTMAEANACGTPVIAFNRGSVKELIEDGKNGYIVHNSAEMILAIEKIKKINRGDCRKHAVDNFSLERMIDSYVVALSDLTSAKKPVKKTTDRSRKKITKNLSKISQRVWKDLSQ